MINRMLVLAVLFFVLQCGEIFAAQDFVVILDPGHGGLDQGGYGGKGFKFNNIWVPEDGYTYDVAKRIERLINKKGWTSFFTIVDKEHDYIYDYNYDYYENKIIPPHRKIKYNLLYEHTIVFGGRAGLSNRLDIAEHIKELYPDSIICFISLHLDYAPPGIYGAKIYTARKMGKHFFVKILAQKFKDAGAGSMCGCRERPMVDDYNRLFILREGVIVPRVLVELGNFNNPRDRICILRHDCREKYAQIVVGALEEYRAKKLAEVQSQKGGVN